MHPIGESLFAELARVKRERDEARAQLEDCANGHKTLSEQRVALDEARAALQFIASNKYGLQGLMEDGASEKEFSKYWSKLAQSYEAIARAALLPEKAEGK